jgi:signal transduction histidine kinase
METMLCPWESPAYLIFSSNIPTLLYYSHAIAVLAALIFALVLVKRVRESRPARWLFICLVLFSLWAVADVLLWASNRPDVVLFYWNLQILLEFLIYASAFYFAYVFIRKHELSFSGKVLTIALIAPILVLLPTTHILQGIDTAYCNALESPHIIFYSYTFQFLLSLTILFIAFSQMHRTPGRAKEIAFFIPGILFFLLAFSSGNIIGSITDDWELAQAGLFGMPIFIGFLAYSAVRFKLFNLKLFSAQALVISLWVLTLSQLFIRTVSNMRIVVLINLVMFTVLGYFLIRGVRREIEQRERIEVLAKDLQAANKQQIALIHFITHQLKGFVAKSRNIFSMMKDGDFGQLPEEMKPIVEEGFVSSTKGSQTIQDILNASNMKSGKISYTKQPFDLKYLVECIVNGLKPNAEAKGVSLTLTTPDQPFTYTGDKMQFENAIKNLVDNSIKYTPSGSIEVSLSHERGCIRFMTKDTGVGITPEDMQHLFTEGGHGAESQLVNVESTGFGLYIVKNIIEAHGGKVWAESEGKGKGTRFFVELPATQ